MGGGGPRNWGVGGTEIEEEPRSRGDPNGFCGVTALEGNLLGGSQVLGGGHRNRRGANKQGGPEWFLWGPSVGGGFRYFWGGSQVLGGGATEIEEEPISRGDLNGFCRVPVLEWDSGIFWGGSQVLGGATEIEEEPKSREDPSGFCGVPVLEDNSGIFWGGSQILGGGGREIKEEPKSKGGPSGFCRVPVLEGNFTGGSQELGAGGTEIEEPKSRGDPSGFCRVPVLEGNLLGGVPGIEGGTEVVLGAGAVGGGPTLTVCSRMAALVSRKPRATWGKI